MSEFTKGEFRAVIPELEARRSTRPRSSAQSSPAGQGLLRPGQEARSSTKSNGRGDHLRVEQLLSVPAQRPSQAEVNEVPAGGRDRVVPGRAAEPGRLDFADAALHPREHDRTARSSAMPAARRRPRRPWAMRTCNQSSRSRCWSNLSRSSRFHPRPSKINPPSAQLTARPRPGPRSPRRARCIFHKKRKFMAIVEVKRSAAVGIGVQKPPCCNGRRRPAMPWPSTRS